MQIYEKKLSTFTQIGGDTVSIYCVESDFFTKDNNAFAYIETRGEFTRSFRWRWCICVNERL